MQIFGLLGVIAVLIAIMFFGQKMLVKKACETGYHYVSDTTCENNGYKK
ncbi:TPA: hypothetical protein ACJEU7_002578 [Acinetobacter baumannii]|nr:hypothetical protein [Acinetobacter baumannii]MCX3034080.1 hypothetical protein [Acinetobacter baumannii]